MPGRTRFICKKCKYDGGVSSHKLNAHYDKHPSHMSRRTHITRRRRAELKGEKYTAKMPAVKIQRSWICKNCGLDLGSPIFLSRRFDEFPAHMARATALRRRLSGKIDILPGTPSANGVRVDPKTGLPLTSSASRTPALVAGGRLKKFCVGCGERLSTNTEARFCGYCGVRFVR